MDFEPTLESSSDRNGAQGRVPCELQAGETVGAKYVLVAPLGLGGMGQVWSATNSATGAEVAVKILHPARTGSADLVLRFRREAAATALLHHRSVVRVFDLVEMPTGALVLVMERLQGETLAEALFSRGACSVRETLRLMVPILSGLAHAHACGVVHRDLKPANIFLALEPDGAVCPKLMDFGISSSRHDGRKLTLQGVRLGTPGYMSPEQASGDAIDARSDVFCAGIVLYECLTGEHPFASENIQGFVDAVLKRDVAPIRKLPKRLWAVLAKALAKNPDERYADALELLCALEAAAPEARRDDGRHAANAGAEAPRQHVRDARWPRLGPLLAAGLVGVLATLAVTRISHSMNTRGGLWNEPTKECTQQGDDDGETARASTVRATASTSPRRGR